MMRHSPLALVYGYLLQAHLMEQFLSDNLENNNKNVKKKKRKVKFHVSLERRINILESKFSNRLTVCDWFQLDHCV